MPQTKENHFYLGNTNLPTPEAKFDYEQHPEWVEDLEKCKKNILYFAENFFYIINLDGDPPRQKIKLRSYQKRILRALRDNRFVILLASRQSSKTTLMTIYALWMACFNSDYRVLTVANKEDTAIKILKRIRTAYEQLPGYLKPGVTEYGKTTIAFGNGSSIGIATTSSDAARGDSVNCVIIDELAFIEPNLVEEFWTAVYPIISSSKRSKIFVASTPNGTGNLFHTLYEGASTNSNGWHAERVDWWEVPGRDEEWKRMTIKTMGSEEAFNQEFGNMFNQVGESVISEELFAKLKSEVQQPKHIFEDGKYLLWDTYKPDHIYTIGVDISEGVGNNASVIQVLDITDIADIQQVAIYTNQNINPLQFIPKCYEIFQHWGSPPVLIERNNCGAQVVDQLKTTYSYFNIVNYGPGAAGANYNRNGIMAHTNTKYKGVMNMRYYVNELVAVKLRDLATIHELKGFIRYPNGTWAAKEESNSYDDRVMSLIWALMVLDNDIVDKYYEILQTDDNKRPLKIAPFDYGVPKQFVDPLKTLVNIKESNGDALPAFGFGENFYVDEDLDKLKQEGWTALNNYNV